MQKIILVLLLLAVPMSATAADFLLNGYGISGKYQIFRFRNDGMTPADVSLIISPSGSGFDAKHVYWPSGVKVGTDIYVYATGEDFEGITSLGLWISENGETFTRWGQVLAPQGDEIEIGSAVVAVDPADTNALFKMWYATKYTGNPSRPREVRYATSSDGKSWARVGTIYAPAGDDEAGGLQISHVCKDGSELRMFYAATPNAAGSTFKAYEARASAADDTFAKVGLIYAPSGVTREVQGSPIAGTRYLTLDSVAGLTEGAVHVIGDNTQTRQQRNVITKIIASQTAIVVEDPMFISGSGLLIKPIELNKVDPSFYYRDANGQGRMILTAWGAFTGGTTNEFTFEAIENADGTFTRDTSVPQRFKPAGPGSLYSLENPTGIRSGVGCVWPE